VHAPAKGGHPLEPHENVRSQLSHPHENVQLRSQGSFGGWRNYLI